VSKSFSWLSVGLWIINCCVISGNIALWHYRLRLKSSWVWRAGIALAAVDFTWGKGKLEMLHNVKLYKHHSVNGVHLALAEPTGNALVDCQF